MSDGAPRPLQRAGDREAPVEFRRLRRQRLRLRVERGGGEPGDGSKDDGALAQDRMSCLLLTCLAPLAARRQSSGKMRAVERGHGGAPQSAPPVGAPPPRGGRAPPTSGSCARTP